ncbi:P2 family phage major capsid protein, partial [Escherichia coli]
MNNCCGFNEAAASFSWNSPKKAINPYLDPAEVAPVSTLSNLITLYAADNEQEQLRREPSVQQTLEDQIQQSAAFLTLINVTPVTEQSGQLLGLGVGSTIAGTTDTTAKEREPVDPTLMIDVEYKCEQTNFDTVLTYAKLDLWAKFQDFQVRIRDAIVKRQALDRIMIGFNGVKRAKTSNRSENPLLQDVNKGWLQKIR